MKHWIGFTLVLLLLLAVGSLSIFRATSPAALAKTECYEFVTALDVLMDHVDEVFYDIPKAVDKEKFKKARKSAQVLAELANLFTHVKEYQNNELWGKYLKEMRVALEQMPVAAKKKDAESVKKLHAVVEGACEGCHEKIRDA